MRILLHGNAPTVGSGYGVQIGLLARRLAADGHDVAISATYGHQCGIGDWHGIRIYPCGYDSQSNDLLHAHANHWFDGDPSAGWIVPVVDVWGITTPRIGDYNVAAWCPIDHFPAPPGVLAFFERSQATPVAMSRFGERLLFDAGLDPIYIPLGVDTDVFRPTPLLPVDGTPTAVRDAYGVVGDRFVVGMVAMNKGWAKDRKGFNEGLWAFGAFAKRHPDAVLLMHVERFGGAEGQNLIPLTIAAGIDDHRIIWSGGTDQYGLRLGFTGQMMAGLYSTMDVLLAPSHGEGFCVPLIEAQACGVPVIATDFSAQSELVGAGWLVAGQPEWDPTQHAAYVCPFIDDVLDKLEEAYAHRGDPTLRARAVEFAGGYDADLIYETHWQPFLAQLDARPSGPVLAAPIPDTGGVVMLCPVMRRPHQVAPLVESFVASTAEGAARLVFVADLDDVAESDAIDEQIAAHPGMVSVVDADRGSSYAQKLNAGYAATTEPWIGCIGDDVRFHAGWLEPLRAISDRYDVIGTNDGGANDKVRTGGHADHFVVRRAYVEELGATLDGPGVLGPECYGHFYCDYEIVKLAKARGRFAPCLDSLLEHRHPAVIGEPIDDVHRLAAERMAADHDTFIARLPLIEMQRTVRARHL